MKDKTVSEAEKKTKKNPMNQISLISEPESQ